MDEFFLYSYKNPYDYAWDFSKSIEENNCECGNFEAIMDKKGNVYQIPNGHTEACIEMMKIDFDLTREEIYDIADTVWYLEWLLSASECLFLRNTFYQGYANEKQLKTIGYLKEKGLIPEEYPKAYLDNYPTKLNSEILKEQIKKLKE